MKPLNLDNRPCSPISSNCVIWQGPTLDCINLCTGDTISDVIAKMATELCTLLDQTNVTNYDLTCLGITTCGPNNFQGLIQLLINKICELNGVTPETRSTPACPDCVVSVAPCFVQNGQTTMQLVDYVQMIANKICDILEQIGDLQDQINNLNIRVTNLEEATPPSFTLPTLTVNCDLGVSSGGVPVNPTTSPTIDIILDALINDNTNGYCIYTGTLGPVSNLLSAIAKKCILDSTDTLSGPGTYGALAGWVPDASYDTVADAINNIWLVLCDIFNYVGSSSVGVKDTNSIDLTITSGVISANIVDTGWVDLNGFSWYGANSVSSNKVPQCRRIGNTVHFRGSIMIPLQDPTNGNEPLVWDYKGSSPLTDTYFLNTTVTPSQVGPGSVVLNSGGSVTFNQGNAVIPSSVVDSGLNFDNSYSLGFKLSFRLIAIDLSPLYSGTLTTLLRPIITSDKKLVLQLVKDYEESAGTGGTPSNPNSTSIANNLISHVRAGEYVPKYQNAASVMASSPNGGTLNTIALPAPLAPDTQYVNNTQLDYDSTLSYGFDCDANNETNLGGFGWIDLDGLMAYLDPCNPDIKVNTPCP